MQSTGGDTLALAGKVAIVTGSTSGIGLGLPGRWPGRARYLFNGFGDAGRSKSCTRHRQEFGSERRSDADMSKPEQIDGMIVRGRQIRRRRHPGQQCRHPACRQRRRVPGRELGRHIAINFFGFHTSRVACRYEAEELGPHHQHCFGARPGGSAEKLAYVAAKTARRANQGHCARDRQYRRDLQRDLPRLGAHTAGAEADRRRAPGARHPRSRRPRRRC